MINKHSIRHYIFQSLGLWLAIFAFYVAFSNGLGNKVFYLQLRRFLPAAFLVFLPCFLSQTRLFSRYFFSHLTVAAMWIVTYPVLYWWTNHTTISFFSNHFDIVFGIYYLVGFTALHLFCLKKIGYSKFLTILLSLIQVVILGLPLFQWIYFFIYKSSISETALVAIYQTNINETIEFVKTIGYGYLVAFILILCFVGYFLYRCNRITGTLKLDSWKSKKSLYFTLLVFLGCGWYLNHMYKETGLLQSYSDVKDYYRAAGEYAQNREQRLNVIQVEPGKPAWQKPGTIILVVGESASRNYMSAYNKTEHDTTPWLREQVGQPGVILFTNAYSPIPNTVKVLEMALTNKNQYNNLAFNQSISILDIAKKAGYHTSWFSNQGTYGSAETQTTLIANTADTAKWTNQALNVEQYDIALLGFLKTVDPQQNNFVILHVMGSHDNFQNRYPPEFTKWGGAKTYDFPLNYDNSLLYTDYVLSKIYEYAKANLNLEAMVYFSDHGQNPRNIRHPDKYGFGWLRIPLYMYLSPEYIAKYPHTYAGLKANRTKYFTNDLLFDTLTGMLNVKSNFYEADNSLTSQSYKWTKETLKVLHPSLKIVEDQQVDDNVK